jgi:hypothetical protein
MKFWRFDKSIYSGDDTVKTDQFIGHWDNLSRFEIIGAALTIIGSFLPWDYTECTEGDGTYVTHGIVIDLTYLGIWFHDNGGMLIILLTFAIILLSIRTPRIITNPVLWNLIISILLLAVSLFLVIRIPLLWTGCVQIRFGLLMVVAGSVLLLWMAVRKYRNSNGMKALAIDD